jgi:hypothetical protein
MDVRPQTIGLVERSDPYEADGIAGAGVVAPDGNATPGAARNLLPLAAVDGVSMTSDLSGEKLNAISLDERVQGERSACLALAPAAVATVNEQRPRRQAIAYEATGAATFAGRAFGVHMAPRHHDHWRPDLSQWMGL